MCARKKRQRFADLHLASRAVEFDRDDLLILNQWIGNRPVILELAAGKGEYTIALAKQYPNHVCIAVDIQGERLWYTLQAQADQKLDNVYVARMPISYLGDILDEHSVHHIWLPFPDPFSKDRDEKKRLVSPRYLALYQKLLAPSGTVHLKTDNYGLFHYAEQTVAGFSYAHIIDCIPDIDQMSPLSAMLQTLLETKTYFEEKHRQKGSRIHYLSWSY